MRHYLHMKCTACIPLSFAKETITVDSFKRAGTLVVTIILPLLASVLPLSQTDSADRISKALKSVILHDRAA